MKDDGFFFALIIGPPVFKCVCMCGLAAEWALGMWAVCDDVLHTLQTSTFAGHEDA